MANTDKTIILGISGASGAAYAQRLLDLLERTGVDCHVIFTRFARDVFARELAVSDLSSQGILGRPSDRITFHDNDNLTGPLASGSFAGDGMVVCPCSSHSISAIATGLGNTLLLRAGYVTLKHKRPLVLVHREMPVTTIDLENMLKLARAGANICPAAPPFYHGPRSIGDLVDAVVGRILDLLGIEHDLLVRWSATTTPL